MTNVDNNFQLDDCEHKRIKCMKCMRDIVPPTAPVQKEGDQPYPTCTPIEGGFLIASGPLEVHVKYNTEGVSIDLIDNTSEDEPMLDSTWELFASCEDPWKTLIDPSQLELP